MIGLKDGERTELSAKRYHRLNEEQQKTCSFVNLDVNLSSLKHLNDVFSAFGLQSDDKLSRREQIKMWTAVRQAMSKEIIRLSASCKIENYDKAKEMRKNLERIKQGFEALQKQSILDQQAQEQKNFSQASSKLQQSFHEEQSRHSLHNEALAHELIQDLKSKQTIQKQNQQFIQEVTPQPPQRWPKRILELQKAESALLKLERFDEAKNVRKMLEKLQAPAAARQQQLHHKQLASRQSSLDQSHQAQSKQLNEHLGSLTWNSRRKSQRERHSLQQRLINLNRDMNRAHARDLRPNSELVIHPSALLQKRSHYHNTTSANFGTRLLDTTRGKSQDDALYVEPLCSIHDFERPLLGTSTYQDED